MKNTLLLTALLAAFSFCKAQIFLEHSYSAGYVDFSIIKLQYTGYKYYHRGINGEVLLFNLDHSPYKQITLPTLPVSAINVKVSYITETLFDSDSTNLEYAVSYDAGMPFGVSFTRIYREDGTLLLSKDSAFIPIQSNLPGNLNPIINTNEGAKMKLLEGTSTAPGNVLVYSLPGLLECGICNGEYSVGTGLPPDGYNTQFKLYPNPSNNFTVVEYDLPKDAENASLVVYNTAGQEQRRFKVEKGSRQMVLPTSEFTAGTYYYSLEIPGLGTTGKKALVIH